MYIIIAFSQRELVEVSAFLLRVLQGRHVYVRRSVVSQVSAHLQVSTHPPIFDEPMVCVHTPYPYEWLLRVSAYPHVLAREFNSKGPWARTRDNTVYAHVRTCIVHVCVCEHVRICTGYIQLWCRYIRTCISASALHSPFSSMGTLCEDKVRAVTHACQALHVEGTASYRHDLHRWVAELWCPTTHVTMHLTVEPVAVVGGRSVSRQNYFSPQYWGEIQCGGTLFFPSIPRGGIYDFSPQTEGRNLH